MPFFLVTQTSLVEAQDEQKAAQTGVDRLRSGGQVTVSVKSDKKTISHVVVAALVEETLVLPASENANSSLAAVCIPEVAFAVPDKRTLILKRMMADALALFVRRT